MSLLLYSYTTPKKVGDFLRRKDDFDGNSEPTKANIENLIKEAESRIDTDTGKTWRLTQETEELHNIEFDYMYDTGKPVYLNFRDMKTFDSNEGDLLEVWNGSAWENWLSTRTEARNRDFWVDYTQGIVYFNTFFLRKDAAIRVTYRHGGLETLLNGALDDSTTTLTVDSTKYFPMRGSVRVNEEEIIYTGKTSTTLTNCTRGAFDTTAASHLDNDIVLDVPAAVQKAATLLVCIGLMENSGEAVIVSETGDQVSFFNKVTSWKKEYERFLEENRSIKPAGGY